ncbi:MAG: MarR family transcriptional regulator [marine bacterium B5-7]|nr:MAG: MarR family transcriptional regulator [marine bacterium B5-7]
MVKRQDAASENASDIRQIFDAFTEIGIIHQLSRTLFEQRLDDSLLLPHFTVLNHLARLGDGVTPLSLAVAFQVPKTTLTHTLSGLEKRALIETRPNPHDGRGKLVFITKSGREFRDNAITSLGPDISRLASEFDFTKLEAVLPVLKELRATLDRYRDKN